MAREVVEGTREDVRPQSVNSRMDNDYRLLVGSVWSLFRSVNSGVRICLGWFDGVARFGWALLEAIESCSPVVEYTFLLRAMIVGDSRLYNL